MSRLVALTRAVPRTIGNCQLTHLARREAIDLPTADVQHAAYERALERCGCRIVRVEREDGLPDSVFVEDTAVVFDDFAVITRPGAESRRAEVSAVAEALEDSCEVLRIEAPGTLDGGDVLRVGDVVYVGVSTRTNPEGLSQLSRLIAPRGYTVRTVPVEKCLHLKSAVTQVGMRTLLLNPAWVERRHFDGFDLIEIDPGEPSAANALMIGDVVIHDQANARTRRLLEDAGITICTVDLSELAKAEGAVTCCSVIVGKR
jgi:dimethylargininase